MAIPNPTLFALGIGVLIVGFLMWRWAGRNSVSVAGAALSTAVASARSGKVIPTVPDDIKDKFDKVVSADSHTERAKIVGGTVARHFIAKFVGLAGLVGMLAGVVMAGAGAFWT